MKEVWRNLKNEMVGFMAKLIDTERLLSCYSLGSKECSQIRRGFSTSDVLTSQHSKRQRKLLRVPALNGFIAHTSLLQNASPLAHPQKLKSLGYSHGRCTIAVPCAIQVRDVWHESSWPDQIDHLTCTHLPR